MKTLIPILCGLMLASPLGSLAQQDTLIIQNDAPSENIEVVPITLEKESSMQYRKKDKSTQDGYASERTARSQEAQSYLKQYKGLKQKSESGDLLFKAVELSNDDIQTLDEQMGYYEIVGDDASMKRIARRMTDTKKYHTDLSTYNSNIVRAIPENAILIVNGEWDTYPLIGQQSLENGQLVVINLQLLEDDRYRNHRLKEKGILVPPQFIDKVTFIRQLYGLNPSRELHIGLTVQKDLLINLGNEISLAGLTFEYGERVSSRELLQTYTEDIEVDHLIIDDRPDDINQLNMNYLPMLSVVKKQYEYDGQKELANEADNLIKKVAKKAGRKEALRMLD